MGAITVSPLTATITAITTNTVSVQYMSGPSIVTQQDFFIDPTNTNLTYIGNMIQAFGLGLKGNIGATAALASLVSVQFTI
jgi:hypothetical protein